MLCASCGGPASQTCANCGTTAYCCKEHQRAHWPNHKASCSPCVQRFDQKLGRYLAATRDLEAGSLLIREWPLVVGPCAWSSPMCLGCHCELLQHSRTTLSCSRCGAPVCNAKCQDLAVHRDGECSVLTPNKGSKLVSHMAAVLPLRCLLGLQSLKSKDSRSQWGGFLQLESHLEKREGSVIWGEQQTHVVEVLKALGLISSDGSEDELIHRICGVLDVNSFEVRGPGVGQLRAVYLRTALMAHDCVPNVHLAVDDELHMVVRANRALKKGENLYYNYCAVLQNTAARREHLRIGKYFECKCERCSDPTELGTHLSSLWCVRCRKGLVVPVSVHMPEQPRRAPVQSPPRWLECRLAALHPLPLALRDWSFRGFPHSHTATRTPAPDAWRCLDCGWRLSGRAAQSTIRRSQDMWDDANRQDPRVLEELLSRLGGSLAPTHALLLDVKQVLVSLYREEARPSQQARVIELCEELLSVLDALEPGRISRLKGIALHEMHIAQILGGGEIKLESARAFLIAAISHLKHEPPNSPEGNLHALAVQELEALTNQMGSLRIRQEQPNNRRKFKSKRSSTTT